MKKLIFLFLILLGTGVAIADEPAAPAPAPKKSDVNPVISVPAGVFRFLYSAFNGVGSLFDEVGSGYKAPKGSLDGKSDPLPVTSMERQF